MHPVGPEGSLSTDALSRAVIEIERHV
ncbi:MAG: hypothetical protein QOG10_3205, partial [Kribbellaceae bacterium]|nr:hypothetical protein [Kribbellaceae bacterium]